MFVFFFYHTKLFLCENRIVWDAGATKKTIYLDYVPSEYPCLTTKSIPTWVFSASIDSLKNCFHFSDYFLGLWGDGVQSVNNERTHKSQLIDFIVMKQFMHTFSVNRL